MDDTRSVHVWIRPEQIALAQGLLSGHEGLGCLRVDRRDTGEVTFWYPPEQEVDFLAYLEDLKNWVEWKPRTADPGGTAAASEEGQQ